MNDNVVLTKVIAEIWGHGDIIKTKSYNQYFHINNGSHDYLCFLYYYIKGVTHSDKPSSPSSQKETPKHSHTEHREKLDTGQNTARAIKLMKKFF